MPADFETSNRRVLRRADEERAAEQSRRRVALEDEYHEHCREKVHAHLHSMPEAERRELLAEKMRAVRRQWGHLPAGTIEELANRQIESELRAKLNLMSFEEFAERNPQESLFN